MKWTNCPSQRAPMTKFMNAATWIGVVFGRWLYNIATAGLGLHCDPRLPTSLLSARLLENTYSRSPGRVTFTLWVSFWKGQYRRDWKRILGYRFSGPRASKSQRPNPNSCVNLEAAIPVLFEPWDDCTPSDSLTPPCESSWALALIQQSCSR